MNVSGRVGTVISKRLATLHELETVYSYEDLLDMYEVILINNINEYRAYKSGERK